MAEELKPCPFCGSRANSKAWSNPAGEFGPGCTECGATADAGVWNTRAMLAHTEQQPVAWRWMYNGEPDGPYAFNYPLPDDDVVRRGLMAERPRTVQPLYAAPIAQTPADFGDAYQGAREDLAIWKRRALEAEQKIRHQEQIIDQLTLEAQGETRFGEPSLPAAGSAGEDVTPAMIQAACAAFRMDVPPMQAMQAALRAALSAQQSAHVSVSRELLADLVSQDHDTRVQAERRLYYALLNGGEA